MLITVNAAGVVTMAHVTLQDKHRHIVRLLLTKVKNISFVSNDAHCGKHFIFCISGNRSYIVIHHAYAGTEGRWRYSANPFTGWPATCSGCCTPRKDMVPIVLEGAGVDLRASLDSQENLAPTKMGL